MSYRSDDCTVEIGRKNVHLRSRRGKESIRQTLTNVEEELQVLQDLSHNLTFFSEDQKQKRTENPICAASAHRSIISLPSFFPAIINEIKTRRGKLSPSGLLNPDCQQKPEAWRSLAFAMQ
jgi:hypothetical protein